MRHLPLFVCLLFTGCAWWSGKTLPEPATDQGLAGAESKLDTLTDKRDSRVAAAVSVAKDASTEHAVQRELELARAMLPDPKPDDLAYARARLERDDPFYAEQLKLCRQLAQAIVEANNRYEAEKARQQAEYAAGIAALKLQLAAEQEARQADKWTYAGIALVGAGLLAAFFTAAKVAAIFVFLTGLIMGAFPMLLRQSWFLPAVGGFLGLLVIGGLAYLAWTRRKASTPPDGPEA